MNTIEDLAVREGDVIAGKYQVERVLGVGGMGFVVAAKHVHLDEPVALKFLHREFLTRPGVAERFTREARAACKIKSEYVARVYDVGMHEGAPFLVMDHLVGRDLYTVLLESGPLPVDAAVEYAMQTCAALAAAHSIGIVHRDVKPENLFLVEEQGLPTVKLLDFGISRTALTGIAFGEVSRMTGAATLGTPLYMSPEQIRSSASADGRSDLWSLGIVLYELLTRMPAFQAESVSEVFAAILEQEPLPLRGLRPEVPPGLVEVIDRCLRKDPEERFQNAAELAAALLPFAPARALAVAERSSSTLGTTAPRSFGRLAIASAASEPSLRLSAGDDRVPSSSPAVVLPVEPSRRSGLRAVAVVLLAAAAITVTGVSYRARDRAVAVPTTGTLSPAPLVAGPGVPAPTASAAPGPSAVTVTRPAVVDLDEAPLGGSGAPVRPDRSVRKVRPTASTPHLS
ncbi:MAG TPA: serine/threonine-protein kinase, partial [Polyangiaceae bacterium]|nr:serine/threonine-protein kinase [Polyangiaceae bacterium]